MTTWDIVDKYQYKIEDEKIFFHPNIPKNKLKNAIKEYANIGDEIPIMLIDATSADGKEEGLILTEKSIYANNNFGKKYSSLLEDIEKISFSLSGLIINDGYEINFTQIKEMSLEQIRHILEEMIGLENKDSSSLAGIGMGVGVGALLGGPVGAAIGGAVGSLVKNKKSAKSEEDSEDNQKKEGSLVESAIVGSLLVGIGAANEVKKGIDYALNRKEREAFRVETKNKYPELPNIGKLSLDELKEYRWYIEEYTERYDDKRAKTMKSHARDVKQYIEDLSTEAFKGRNLSCHDAINGYESLVGTEWAELSVLPQITVFIGSFIYFSRYPDLNWMDFVYKTFDITRIFTGDVRLSSLWALFYFVTIIVTIYFFKDKLGFKRTVLAVFDLIVSFVLIPSLLSFAIYFIFIK